MMLTLDEGRIIKIIYKETCNGEKGSKNIFETLK